MDFISLFTWENWGLERISSFPKVTWLVSGWARIQPQVSRTPKALFFLLYHIGSINRHDFLGGGEEVFEMWTISLFLSPLGLILSLTSKTFHSLDFTNSYPLFSIQASLPSHPAHIPCQPGHWKTYFTLALPILWVSSDQLFDMCVLFFLSWWCWISGR